jgi:hypothetical protein
VGDEPLCFYVYIHKKIFFGSDERESYDAGFASGVKATLQQLYGLLHEYPTLDEIEAWADSQWEEYE